jgi:hypothetical protein
MLACTSVLADEQQFEPLLPIGGIGLLQAAGPEAFGPGTRVATPAHGVRDAHEISFFPEHLVRSHGNASPLMRRRRYFLRIAELKSNL